MTEVKKFNLLTVLAVMGNQLLQPNVFFKDENIETNIIYEMVAFDNIKVRIVVLLQHVDLTNFLSLLYMCHKGFEKREKV